MRRNGHQLIATLTAAELVAVALVAPLLLFPTPARLLAALVIPAIWIARRAAGGRLVPATPLNAPLVLLLAMVGVSVLVTFDVRFSLGKVAGVLLGILAYWAIVGWTTTAGRLSAAALAFQLAGAGLAAVGLVGINWSTKFPAFSGIVSHLPAVIRGLQGAEEGFQPNGVAGLLILFVPLQLALLVVDRRRRALGGVLLGVTGGTLLLTQSRGAWAGLLAAGLVFLVGYGARTRMAAAALSVTGGVAALLLGPVSLLKLVISRSGTGIADSLAGRLDLWSSALAGIQDFPITGMGMNAFRRVMPVMYPAALTPPDVDIAHAHNHVLQAALDLGLPGLAAYLWIWAIVSVLLVRLYRTTTDPVHRAMAGGLGLGLLAHFCFGMTDAVALGAKAGILFWFTLALAIALHQVARCPRLEVTA